MSTPILRILAATGAYLTAALLLCGSLTVVVAGAASHLGPQALTPFLLWLAVGDLLIGAGALVLYAGFLGRVGVDPRWPWVAMTGLVLLALLAVLGLTTLVVFNR